jgi:transcription antitermination factor NusG
MITARHWYAIYTKPRREKKTADLLTKKGIINYCPLNRRMRQWSDRKKIVLEPLFTSYVFVQVALAEIAIVNETEGVMHFVRWLGKPAVIKEEEISAIRNFLNNYQDVLVTSVNVQVNDVVRIVRGPLSHYEGNVISMNKTYVKLYLPSLRYLMFVEVEKSYVELIKHCG